ncbi:hypothetical protein [Brevifollis gellanilyticus]|uniref:Uncharacterized protein n=1 Tax=Brevifollis gellanilyticus TaxID=748831 RepID=A0A512MHW0_9BACT|nr:hypothetical protein [Brevifollis gellanilyticus]GEP46309.1 hypothetical protein BGE01nite_56000 [Brevifollis gellanilyticus]
MTPEPQPSPRRLRQPLHQRLSRPLALLSLLLTTAITVTVTTTALAAELPQIGTPWDIWATHRVGDEFSGELTLLEPGSGAGDPVYSCIGLPPELKLDKTTGTISGTIRSVGYFNVKARVSVGGLQSPVVTRRIALMPPYVPDPGIFEHAYSHFELPPLGGHVNIIIQPSGAYSGLLRLGTRSVPLAGVLKPNDPELPYVAAGAPVLIRLPRPEGTRLVKVVVRSSNPELGLDFLDAATGEIVAGDTSLHLVRPSVGFIPPCAQVGRHNVAFLPDTNPPATGAAFGIVTIGADYRWTFVGQSPHGKSITSSQWGYPMDDGLESTPLEVATDFYSSDNATTCLYGGLMIPAKVRLRGEPGLQYGIRLVHLPQKGRLIPEGGMEATYTFLSSRYDRGRAQTMFPQGSASLASSALFTSDIPSVMFVLNPRLRAVFGAGTGNPTSARLDVYAPTGLFTGQFTLKDPDPRNRARSIFRKVNYRGILLPDHHLGAGNFLLPTLPDPNAQPPTTLATSPIVSGDIQIVPAPVLFDTGTN